LRIVAAAGEGPAAAQQIAAVGGNGFGGRRVGAAGQRIGVGIPDVALGLFGEARNQPLMGREQPADPGGRRARFRQLDVEVDQDIEIILVTTEGARLDDIEIADLP